MKITALGSPERFNVSEYESEYFFPRSGNILPTASQFSESALKVIGIKQTACKVDCAHLRDRIPEGQGGGDLVAPAALN